MTHALLAVLFIGALTAAAPSDPGLGAGAAIRKYAPMVWIAEGELHNPIGANKLLAASPLYWAHDQDCTVDTPIPRETGDWRTFASKLGAGKYVASTQDADCNVEPGLDHRFDSNQHTRPYDAGRPRLSPDSREGFYLKIPPELHPGGPINNQPVYWEFKNHHYVTYWFLYAWNHANSSGPQDKFSAGDHQGDWERISVKLNDFNRAVQVAYYFHDSYCTVQWASVGKYHGHPVVFSARGSHASYRTVGIKPRERPLFDDLASKGTRWRTYNNLRKLGDQRWYQNGSYGGAWGMAAPETDLGTAASRLFSGPLGPSLYKSGVVEDWKKDCF